MEKKSKRKEGENQASTILRPFLFCMDKIPSCTRNDGGSEESCLRGFLQRPGVAVRRAKGCGLAWIRGAAKKLFYQRMPLQHWWEMLGAASSSNCIIYYQFLVFFFSYLLTLCRSSPCCLLKGRGALTFGGVVKPNA